MRRFLLGVAAALCACGGATVDTGDAGDAGKVVKDAGLGDAPGQPPPPQDGGPPTSETMTFAVNTVYLGEGDRSGTVSSTAWKGYGFNLDGLVSDKSSTDVCTLYAGAPKTNQTDGTNGVDNSWGETLLPLIQTAASLPNPSQSVSQTIAAGAFTVQVQVTGLSDDPNQTANGLKAQIFLSGQYGPGTPSFDSSTSWPVLPSSLQDGQTIESGAIAHFDDAYVENGTFVSGKGTDPLVLSLDVQGVAFTFNVHDAILTFDHKSQNSITNGTIAGTLDTQEFVATMKKAAPEFTTALCGSAFDGIAQQIEQASDILDDGTNQPGTPCTAISIGIGFDAALIANPTEVSLPPSPPPDPCQQ
ncbi:MAG TPA: hypothetical protein VGH28_11565 [Polyangiaceae bacterium]|jgi:hypothetical protein